MARFPGRRAPSLIARRVVVTFLLLSGPIQAAPPSASPDVSVALGGSVVRPADVVDDLAAPAPTPIDLGTLPAQANVVAYLDLGPSARFFVVEPTVTLPGGVVASPRDVVAYDGASYAIELDGDSFLPVGSAIDALGATSDPLGGDVLLISFDTTVVLSGSLVVEPADLFDLVSGSLWFDASAAGVPPGADLDAVSGLPAEDALLVSFDISGSVGGVAFADEDVLRFTPSTGTWSMELDGSATQPGLARADLDAIHFVPEPGRMALLVPGLCVLAALARRRGACAGRCRGPHLRPEGHAGARSIPA